MEKRFSIFISCFCWADAQMFVEISGGICAFKKPWAHWPSFSFLFIATS